MYKDKEFQENVMRISTLLRAKEVAEILKVSRTMAYNLMLRGEIPTVRNGKCRRVRSEDLILYIKKQHIPGKPVIKRIESQFAPQPFFILEVSIQLDTSIIFD